MCDSQALNTALGMVKKNFYVASIDLTDAYYSVPVATVDQTINVSV